MRNFKLTKQLVLVFRVIIIQRHRVEEKRRRRRRRKKDAKSVEEKEFNQNFQNFFTIQFDVKLAELIGSPEQVLPAAAIASLQLKP